MKPKKRGKLKQALTGNIDKPIPRAYSTIDTDLARDNLENDIPAADLQDLEQ